MTSGHGRTVQREVETERAAGPADEAAAEQRLRALDADSDEEESDDVLEQ
jgi:hypothetical protein